MLRAAVDALLAALLCPPCAACGQPARPAARRRGLRRVLVDPPKPHAAALRRLRRAPPESVDLCRCRPTLSALPAPGPAGGAGPRRRRLRGRAARHRPRAELPRAPLGGRASGGVHARGWRGGAGRRRPGAGGRAAAPQRRGGGVAVQPGELLARRLGVPVAPWLARVRDTQPQVALPAARRHGNVRDAFAVTRAAAAGIGGAVIGGGRRRRDHRCHHRRVCASVAGGRGRGGAGLSRRPAVRVPR